VKTMKGEGMRANCMRLYPRNAGRPSESILEVGSRAWHMRQRRARIWGCVFILNSQSEERLRAKQIPSQRENREDPSLIVSHWKPRLQSLKGSIESHLMSTDGTKPLLRVHPSQVRP